LNARCRAKPVFMTVGWVSTGLWLVGVSLLVVIVVDYFKAEADFQRVRMEVARVAGLPTAKPAQLIVLTQLQERIAFIRYSVKEDMTPQELAWVKNVAGVYPGSGGLYKAAKAMALNSNGPEAKMLLKKACKVATVQECKVIEFVWKQDSEASALIAAVPWPN